MLTGAPHRAFKDRLHEPLARRRCVKAGSWKVGSKGCSSTWRLAAPTVFELTRALRVRPFYCFDTEVPRTCFGCGSLAKCAVVDAPREDFVSALIDVPAKPAEMQRILDANRGRLPATT